MKKLLLIIPFSILCSSLAFSQGVWTSRDTLPDTAMVQGISGFSINGYGYAGLGNDEYSFSKLSNKLWRFDPSTNSWAQMASFPGSARVAPASFVIGNKAYLVTGSVKSSGTCVTECWEYNATNNTWTQKTNFPGPARTYAVGFSIGNKGYVGTGANELSDFRKDFYAYDTAGNGSWTRIADFGGIARSGASGFAVNGKGYVCFGQDSTIKYYGDMWEYDTGTNSWTRKNNIPPGGATSPHMVASGFSICNNIYIGSGVDSAFNTTHEFWKYNTLLDNWTQETSVPGITKIQGAAFAIGDTGYYGFGFDSVSRVLNVFDRFYAGDNCNQGMGYNTIANVSEINIYPNPNKGICTLTFNQPELQAVIEVYNVFGVKVYGGVLTQAQQEYEINISNQSNGIYLYRVISQSGNLLSFGKLIIQ